jgi:hypothetical protein
MSSLKASGFSLLPPCRGKVGMGVEILIAFILGFYPLPSPPPAWGRGWCWRILMLLFKLFTERSNLTEPSGIVGVCLSKLS